MTLKLFSEDHPLPVFSQWAQNCAALSRLAVRQTVMINQLVDMEWKFGGKSPSCLSSLVLWVKTGGPRLAHVPPPFVLLDRFWILVTNDVSITKEVIITNRTTEAGESNKQLFVK